MYYSAFLSLALLPAAAFAKVQFLGVAIAGGDFGCSTDGTCLPESAQLPLSDGPDQMSHFVKDDGLNLLRIPTSWQFLVNGQLGGDIDASKFSEYDQLIQACLDTGAYCMIDIHNFARWNGQIIGQGGPTDEQFASFWGQLAGKYVASDKVIFELMNEPHDLDIDLWAQTCQTAVTAIREAGATSQMILLPGTNFASAETLVSSGSVDALINIINPDGSTDNLLLDIHKYLDDDNSGTHAECSTDNVDSFTILALYLRSKGRKGFISETGASSDASCLSAFCDQNSFINTNSDVFTGLVAWGAGSFDTSYTLSLTPTNQNGRLVDSALMTQCVLGTWTNGHSNNGTMPTQTLSSSAVASSTATTTSSGSTATTKVRASSSSSTSTFTTPSSSSLLPTPSVSLTASRNPAVSHMPTKNNNSTITSTSEATPVSTINTSDVLILTDILPYSISNTMTTLAIATGTPPSRSGLGGLLTAESNDNPLIVATPTGTGRGVSASSSASASSTPAAAAAGGAGSIELGLITLWSCVVAGVISTLLV